MFLTVSKRLSYFVIEKSHNVETSVWTFVQKQGCERELNPPLTNYLNAVPSFSQAAASEVLTYKVNFDSQNLGVQGYSLLPFEDQNQRNFGRIECWINSPPTLENWIYWYT